DCAVETHPTGTEFGVDIDRFSQEVGYRVATDIEQVSYAEITEIGDRSIVTRLKHRDTVVEAERIACEGEGIDAADQNLEHLSRRRRRDDDFLSRQSFFVVIEDRQAIEGIGRVETVRTISKSTTRVTGTIVVVDDRDEVNKLLSRQSTIDDSLHREQCPAQGASHGNGTCQVTSFCIVADERPDVSTVDVISQVVLIVDNSSVAHSNIF